MLSNWQPGQTTISATPAKVDFVSAQRGLAFFCHLSTLRSMGRARERKKMRYPKMYWFGQKGRGRGDRTGNNKAMSDISLMLLLLGKKDLSSSPSRYCCSRAQSIRKTRPNERCSFSPPPPHPPQCICVYVPDGGFHWDVCSASKPICFMSFFLA